MQVILLEKVANLGNLGDVVKVRDGYARNFLIPTRLARRATEAAIQEFEARRADLEKAAADKLAAARALGEQLAGKTVRITQRAGVDGRLFGSVTNHDIAGAPAQWSAEDSGRAHGVGGSALRRDRRRHGPGGRAGRVTGRFRPTPEGPALPAPLAWSTRFFTGCPHDSHNPVHRPVPIHARHGGAGIRGGLRGLTPVRVWLANA
jgi:ribosomal protein L9